MDTYNHNEFSVQGTTITHVPSGAWWKFNYNSPAIQSLRRSARCSKCGAKGASLMLPSWVSTTIGFAPFPVKSDLRP